MYGYEILKYFQGIYNYDGMRYLVPITITDAMIIVSLIILYFTYYLSKELCILLCLGILHNISQGCGVERIPFIGFIIAIVSIFYAIKLF